MVVISKYIHDDFDSDKAIDWAISNCPSFEKYMLVELDWEEKQSMDCWFRFDVYFKDEKDAVFYSLKWI